jgi:hypothetical protein
MERRPHTFGIFAATTLGGDCSCLACNGCDVNAFSIPRSQSPARIKCMNIFRSRHGACKQISHIEFQVPCLGGVGAFGACGAVRALWICFSNVDRRS